MAGEILFQSVKEFVVYIAQSPPGSYLFWSTIGAMILIVHQAIWRAFKEERMHDAPPSSFLPTRVDVPARDDGESGYVNPNLEREILDPDAE